MFREVLVAGLVVLLIGCGPSKSSKAKEVAGGMTAKEICAVMGAQIRRKLGNNVKTIDMPCRVVSVDGGSIQMSSAYKSPLNRKKIHYTAKGHAYDRKFSFYEIKLEGDDEKFELFANW